jgi:hypothetical protein
MYHVGSGKVSNLPSCVLEFIRDIIPDKKVIYRGRSFQLYGNQSPVREVLLMESEGALRCIRTEMTNKVTNLGVYYELPSDCTLQNYNHGYIDKKCGRMFCETFIAFLSRTCSKTVVFVTYHGDVDVDEEGFMTMMFELGKTYSPDDALGNEWISEGAINDMDRCDARRKHHEQKVRAILNAPPETKRKRENRVKREDALFGERKLVMWDDYEQGSSLPF